MPDGKVGHDAFAVIRETIRSMNKVAIGRVVLTNREHIIALEPLGKGLMGTLLRYPYEVRSEKEYFDDIQDVKVTKDMLDLAKHIVEKKSGSFEPDKFEDHYESALIDLINKKRSGIRTTAKAAPKTGGNVINLMDALKRSLANERQPAPPARIKGKKPKKRIEGQREMLLPISGKGAAQGRNKDAGAQKSRQTGARARSIEKGRLGQRHSRRPNRFGRRRRNLAAGATECHGQTPSMAIRSWRRTSVRRPFHEAPQGIRQQER